MKYIFIIEHLEPRLWKWCLIEYKHISKIVGKGNVWFTNLKKSDLRKLRNYGKVFSGSVGKMNLKKVCVLDPEASESLTPSEAKKFSYFVFGGILGDYPRKKRTQKELTPFVKKASVRNIGKKQFPTDNAVYAVREITNGKKLSELKFANKFSLKINEIETIELPFRHVVVDKRPLISEEIVKYLGRKNSF